MDWEIMTYLEEGLTIAEYLAFSVYACKYGEMPNSIRMPKSLAPIGPKTWVGFPVKYDLDTEVVFIEGDKENMGVSISGAAKALNKENW
jgi:hypothetical protein